MKNNGLENYGFDEFLKTKFVQPPRPVNFIGEFNLEHWHYLGSTELGFPLVGDAAIVSFFVAKECPDVRDYHVSYDKNVREFDRSKSWEFHPFMANQVLPWQYNQVDVYRPIRSTFSKYLVEYMKETHQAFWDPKIGGWRSTKTDPNAQQTSENVGVDAKYEAALEKQRADKIAAVDEAVNRNKKASETSNRITGRNGNVINVDFTSKPPPAKDD